MARAADQGPSAPARVGALEVTFNLAFAPQEGAYLCSSPADATFTVKSSLSLPVATDSGPAETA